MNKLLNHSSCSAFKPFTSIFSAQNIERENDGNSFYPLWSEYPFTDFLEKYHLKQEIQQESLTQRGNQKDEDSLINSPENSIPSDHASDTKDSIGDRLEAPKKRKNKEETKQEIQEKQKDDGRGGNCIASNITKTLIRVTLNRLQTTLSLKFRALIEKYKIKSQKENTIVILLILYDLVKTQQMSISTFENIFSFFMKSLNESKENCEKKMADEPERKGFHLKNRKMYVNFININREIFSKLVQALKESQPIQMDLKTISDIISDTYDRKQRQIQKALSKLKSIILNHASLKALFGHKQNDIEGTLLEAIDYAYRRNLEKRCNQTKKKVMKFMNGARKNQQIASEEEQFFMCYAALKLVSEKEGQIWEEFAKSTNLKRQYNQTEQEGQTLSSFLNEKIPKFFSEFESMKEAPSTSEDFVKMEEETDAKSGFLGIFRTFISSRNDMEF